MLKVGMVGVGNISGIYLQNLTETFKELELVAVCDLIKERALKAQEKWGVPKVYDTMQELFADEEIDVVLNLTRPYQHYEVSRQALLAGKHVYSEKPLGITFEEGKSLVALANEKGLWLGGAPDTFLGAAIQTARKLIDDGLIGEPIGGRFCMAGHGMETWHPDPDFFYQRGGGPLFDMGPYYVTAATNLLGRVKKVYGYATISYPERLITSEPLNGTKIKVTTPTHIEALLHFENGTNASLLTSFDLYKANQPKIEIYGTKGTLLVPDPNHFGGDVIFYDETGKETTYSLTFDYPENSRGLGLADMAKAIETGRRGRTTYRQTLHTLEIMDGILKSARSGAPVDITSDYEREAPMDPTLEHGIL